MINVFHNREKAFFSISGIICLLLNIGLISAQTEADSAAAAKKNHFFGGRRAWSDSLHMTGGRDSLVGRPFPDSLGAAHIPGSTRGPLKPDSVKEMGIIKQDSAKILPLYRLSAASMGPERKKITGIGCRAPYETVPQRLRCLENTAAIEDGFPGTRAGFLSMGDVRNISYKSLYNPVPEYSPYLTGGIIIPDAFSIQTYGGRVSEIRELWVPPSMVDTPHIGIDWERGAFALNLFQLDYSRLLTQNTFFRVKVFAASADSLEYVYAFQVHQPFLGLQDGMKGLLPFMERDSASMVIQGTSQQISAMNFRPEIGFFPDSNTVIEAYIDNMRNGTDLVSPVSAVEKHDLYDEPIQVPLRADFKSLVFGGTGYSRREWGSLFGRFFYGGTEQHLPSYNPLHIYNGSTDTNYSKESISSSNASLLAELALTSLPARPEVRLDIQNEIISGPLFLRRIKSDSDGVRAVFRNEGWMDRQKAEILLYPEYGPLAITAGGGGVRHSLIHNEIRYSPFYSVMGKYQLPAGIHLSAGAGYEEIQPGWADLYSLNSVMSRYPSPGLKGQGLSSSRIGAGFISRHFSFDAGLNFNNIKNPFLPAALPFKARPDTTDSLAFRLVNYDDESRNSLSLRTSLALGNWVLFLEDAFMYQNEVTGAPLGPQQGARNTLLPHSVYKGGLTWENRFVSDRLGVRVSWNWEWYSIRYAWASRMNGTASSEKLDEYLALDFRAHMQIRTFILYYQIKNFNHDRYTLQPGHHPPGINFRWGVNWQLDG